MYSPHCSLWNQSALFLKMLFEFKLQFMIKKMNTSLERFKKCHKQAKVINKKTLKVLNKK